MSAEHTHEQYQGLNPIKRLSHCYCNRLHGDRHQPGFFERFLMWLIPHFDIIKTIPCNVCTADIDTSDWTHCPFCLNGTHTVLYLRRFYLFRSKWLGLNFGDIYLHHIVRSDDDKDPHDHPWGFVGLVLKGGYVDEQYRWLRKGEMFRVNNSIHFPWRFSKADHRSEPQFEAVKPLRLIYRPAEHIHKVVLDGNKTAWTLIFTSKYRRDWNFVTENGPVPWRKYLGIPDEVDYGE